MYRESLQTVNSEQTPERESPRHASPFERPATNALDVSYQSLQNKMVCNPALEENIDKFLKITEKAKYGNVIIMLGVYKHPYVALQRALGSLSQNLKVHQDLETQEYFLCVNNDELARGVYENKKLARIQLSWAAIEKLTKSCFLIEKKDFFWQINDPSLSHEVQQEQTEDSGPDKPSTSSADHPVNMKLKNSMKISDPSSQRKAQLEETEATEEIEPSYSDSVAGLIQENRESSRTVQKISDPLYKYGTKEGTVNSSEQYYPSNSNPIQNNGENVQAFQKINCSPFRQGAQQGNTKTMQRWEEPSTSSSIALMPDSVKNSKAYQMMKNMGWGGRGLGSAEQGRCDFIAVRKKYNRGGIGFVPPTPSKNKNKDNAEGCKPCKMKKKTDRIDNKEKKSRHCKPPSESLQKLLTAYSQSSKLIDLAFSADLTNEDRQTINKYCHSHLKNVTTKCFGRGKERYITVSQKVSPLDMLRQLIREGLKTESYELKIPDDFKETFQKIVSSQQ